MNRMRKIMLCILTIFCLLACSAAEAEKPVEIGNTVKMPDLRGQPMVSAVENLNSLGFENITAQKSNETSDDSRFIVTDQNIEAGTETDPAEKIILTCMRQFELLLNIESEKNLLFSKYDLDILVDNEKLGTVKNGEQFEGSVQLIEGDHELTVCKHGEEATADTYQIKLKADTELAFTASHGKSSVSIRNPVLNEKEEVISRTQTPKPTQEPTPTPTPEETPAPTPIVTPTPTPEPSAETTAEAASEPSAEAEEATVLPEETIETEEPLPTLTPESAQEETPESSAETEEVLEKTTEEEQVPELTPVPESDITAEPTPEISPEPSANTEGTEELPEEPAETQGQEAQVMTEETAEAEEPVQTAKPFSTIYANAKGYKNGRAGSYVFKVPDTWEKNDKRFDVSKNGKGAYFTYGQGEGEDIDTLSIPQLLNEYLSQFEFEEIIENDKSYYFGGNKTYYVKGIEKVNEKKSRIHEIYMFADKLFRKPVIFNFYQPVDSKLDYSRDFRAVMYSVADYTYTVKDVLTKGYEVKYSTDVLEYSDKETDPLKFVSTKKKGVVITTDDKIDLTKLGKQTVTYTFTRGLISASEEHVFTVKDTKKPKIKIKEKEITLKYNKKYDPFDNIVSVKDPVDGALELVKKDPGEPGNGWYYLEGPKDIDSPGIYEFTIHACDKNGKKTKKSFTVQRKKKPAPKYDYIANRNTGKFHYTYCPDVSKMKEKNKVYYNNVTRKYMIGLGYEPCQHCYP